MMKWQNSSNYTPKEMAAMQKDAMERVKEMQRRADESLRRSNPEPKPEPIPPQQPVPPPAAEVQNPPNNQPAVTNSPAPAAPQSPVLSIESKLGQICSALGIDRDHMIILGLLLVLWNDGADRKLLLALLYLLL